MQPSGTVTFLFTDIEDHSRLWESAAAEMPSSLEAHDRVVRDAIGRNGGYVFSTAGDAFSAAFPSLETAVSAAVEAQQGLRSHSWPAGCELRVRMGLHTGEAHERDGDYFGPAVIRAARLMSLGHGGQVLVSEVTADLLRDRPIRDVDVVHVGEVALRGLGRAEQVSELRAPGLATEFPPLAGGAPRRGNVPQTSERFIGRSGELDAASDLVSVHSLVTLTGPGGVGKTRLASEIGSIEADRLGDGVWFVPLAAVTEDAAVPSAVAEVLGVQETAGKSLTDSIVGAISGRELLLILDNCEHVVQGARHVATAVASQCDTVVVLATSREPLAVPDEHVLPVPPLSLERDGGRSLSPAAELFVARASSADSGFVTDDESLPVITAVCDQLDGMPLAIELAAARVRGLGLSGLATHLDDRFRLLRSSGAVDERHRTLRATVGWSYDLLDERLQGVFCRAGVFAGSFSAAAAEHVLAFGGLDALDIADGLADLVDKSMLQAVPVGNVVRYRMLETMRQFGADEFDPEDRRQAWERFVHHHVDWCRETEELMKTSDTCVAYGRFHAELDNLREAFRLARVLGLTESAAAIVTSLHTFSQRCVVGEPWSWAEELAADLTPDRPSYGDVVMMAAWGCRARGDREGAARYLHAVEEVEETGELVPSAFTDSLHGVTYWFFNQTERSVQLQERSIATSRAAGDRYRLAQTLSSLSMAQDSFDRAAAEQTAREALAVGRELGNPEAICGGLLALAGVVVHANPDKAVGLTDEMIDLAADSDDLWHLATGTRLKAHALSRRGDVHEASMTYARALELNGVGDFGELLWYTVINVIEHLLRLGDDEAAAVALGALDSAPAAPSDDLVARATTRMRTRLEQTHGATESTLKERGAAMKLAALLRYLDERLTAHAIAPS